MLSYYKYHSPAEPSCQPLAEDPGVLLANVYGALSNRADVTVSLQDGGGSSPAAVP